MLRWLQSLSLRIVRLLAWARERDFLWSLSKVCIWLSRLDRVALDSFLIRALCLIRMPRIKHLCASHMLNGLTSSDSLIWKKRGISFSSSFLTVGLDRRVFLSFQL